MVGFSLNALTLPIDFKAGKIDTPVMRSEHSPGLAWVWAARFAAQRKFLQLDVVAAN
jgi:hypothetical protein